jgi:hypothetical protein
MKFDQEATIMKAYIDSAKNFVQLSTGALVLSVTFHQQVLGESGRVKMDGALLASWGAFVLAIGCGAFYQYLAIKYLDARTESAGKPGPIPERLRENPGIVFGAMLVLFFAGAALLTVSVARAMALG